MNKQNDTKLILDLLENQIKKHLKETVVDEREDLTQDMKIKIIEKAGILLDEKVPGFFEYISSL